MALQPPLAQARDDNRPTWSEQRATAIHEAGHATVAYLLQRALTSISVVPDEDSLGRVCHPPTPNWFQPDIEVARVSTRFAQDHIMILLAGRAAQAAWCSTTVGAPDDWSQMNDHQAERDFRNAYDLADYMIGSPRQSQAYLEWLKIRSADQVKNPLTSRLIEGLADELERTQTLTCRKARTFLKNFGNHPDWTRFRAGPYL